MTSKKMAIPVFRQKTNIWQLTISFQKRIFLENLMKIVWVVERWF
jgi:hypothetical protein